MKKKQRIKELNEKNVSQLQNLLAEKRETLRELNFKAAQNQLKNVRDIRKIKQEIGQILSVLNKQK